MTLAPKTPPTGHGEDFQIINHRYVNQLPTVVTSNLPTNDFEGRIRSRIRDPNLVTVVKILAPDYRNPVDDIGHPGAFNLSLHSRQTFGSFSLRQNEKLPAQDLKDLKHAFEVARQYAEHPGWLVLTGPYGCGKTHLAAAIGNYQTGLGFPPLMVSVPTCWITCGQPSVLPARFLWTGALKKCAQPVC